MKTCLRGGSSQTSLWLRKLFSLLNLITNSFEYFILSRPISLHLQLDLSLDHFIAHLIFALLVKCDCLNRFGHGLVKSLELILLFSFGFAFICIFMDGNRDGFAWQMY